MMDGMAEALELPLREAGFGDLQWMESNSNPETRFRVKGLLGGHGDLVSE